MAGHLRCRLRFLKKKTATKVRDCPFFFFLLRGQDQAWRLPCLTLVVRRLEDDSETELNLARPGAESGQLPGVASDPATVAEEVSPGVTEVGPV